MAENDELAVSRQQLKTEIQSGKHKSLGGFMIDGLGHLVQKTPFLLWLLLANLPNILDIISRFSMDK